MAVIDTVINGLKHCKRADGEKCSECPYFHAECTSSLSADALALLESLSQQRTKANITQVKDCGDFCGLCKTCNKLLALMFFGNDTKYCPYCGKAIEIVSD